MKEKLTCEFKFNSSNSPKNLAQMLAFVCVLIYILVIIVIVEWKIQSDEYDKELEELRKKEAGINATLAQLQRQVRSKVIYLFFIIKFKHCKPFITEDYVLTKRLSWGVMTGGHFGTIKPPKAGYTREV